MSKQPLFSIIIPVYNVQDYLAQCLDSVLNQTFQHYEIILIDDGSSDDSSQICAQYALKYPQITLLKQPNQGVSVARNRGIQLARGNYVIFLDSDDYWCHNNALQEISQIIEKTPMLDMILFGITSYNMQNKTSNEIKFNNIEGLSNDFQLDFEKLVKRDIFFSSTTNKVIRRQILLNHQIIFQPNRRYEDFAFYFDLALHIQKYAIYNQAFYYYQFMRLGSSSTSNNLQNAFDYLDLLTERLPIVKQMCQTNHTLSHGLFHYWNENFKHIEKLSQINNPSLLAGLLPNLKICASIVNQLRTQFKLAPMVIPQPPKRQFTFSANTTT